MWLWCEATAFPPPGDDDWEWAIFNPDNPAVPLYDICTDRADHTIFYEVERHYLRIDGGGTDTEEDEAEAIRCQDCNAIALQFPHDQWKRYVGDLAVAVGWVRCGYGECSGHVFRDAEDLNLHTARIHDGIPAVTGERGIPIFDADLIPIHHPVPTTHEAW